MKVVIVGGVAGGATAAARIRRLDEHAEIVIFERSGYMSYANCGLPYYIGGVITDPEALSLQTPKKFWDRFRVAVRVRHEVTAIDRMAKTVSVRNLETGKIYAEGYDRLLLSPGARPTLPPVRGGRPRPGDDPAHRGGYPPDPPICRDPSTQTRGAGGRGLHQP